MTYTQALNIDQKAGVNGIDLALNKFNLDAVVIRAGTIGQLERRKTGSDSIYRHYPVQVASIDFLKSDRNKHLFLLDCPDLVIVDEAHGSASASEHNQSQHQRHAFVSAIAALEDRRMILLAAGSVFLIRKDELDEVRASGAERDQGGRKPNEF